MNLNIWPKDATDLPEKIAYVMMKVFAPAAYLYLQLSAWQVFKNCYQQTVSHYGAGWHILGVVLFLATVALIYGAVTDANILTKLGRKWNTIVNVGVFILSTASVLSYSAFAWWFNVCQ